MDYDKTIIDINISFDNDIAGCLRLPRRSIVRKTAVHKITPIQPSPESQRTSSELQKRVLELQMFRKESQSADVSPLLVTAQVKRTQDQLTKVDKLEKKTFKKVDGFRKAARIVFLLVSSCRRWRRYRREQKEKKELGGIKTSASDHNNQISGIAVEKHLFHESSKLDLELREIMTCLPRMRTHDQLKKVQRLIRKTRSFFIFHVEKELEVARHVGYERYDDSRVIACQGRQPQRFYYIISGRVSKVRIFNLASGVNMKSVGELLQGSTTDPIELQNGTLREHSLICQGRVEVLVLERDDFLCFINRDSDTKVPAEYFKSIALFQSFPIELFLQDKGSHTTKYFGKDSVIVKNCFQSPYFFIVKTGQCKVIREQDVPDLKTGDKLPTINSFRKPCSNDRNDTNLLELSKAFSRDFSLQNTKGKTEADGHITSRKKVEDQETFITKNHTSKILDFIPVNSLRSEKQNKPEKPHRKAPEVNPTRKALLQIATLKPGDMFGLEPMIEKATSRIFAVESIVNTADPAKKQLILISDGAECIMVNKRFFLKNASMATLIQLRAMREEYMSVENARRQIQNQQMWTLYKRELVNQLAQKTKIDKS